MISPRSGASNGIKQLSDRDLAAINELPRSAAINDLPRPWPRSTSCRDQPRSTTYRDLAAINELPRSAAINELPRSADKAAIRGMLIRPVRQERLR